MEWIEEKRRQDDEIEVMTGSDRTPNRGGEIEVVGKHHDGPQ